jgi:hypothetical protein
MERKTFRVSEGPQPKTSKKPLIFCLICSKMDFFCRESEICFCETP